MTDLPNESATAACCAQAELLGSDFVAICARYGAPVRCEHDHGVLRLLYAGDQEQASRGSVDLVDGVVVSITGRLQGARHMGSGQEMVGWPIEVVLPRLGKPDRTVALGDSACLEFEHYTVTIHEGTVACVVPRGEQPKASA